MNRMLSRFALPAGALLVLWILTACAPLSPLPPADTASDAMPAAVTVDVDTVIGPVSPLLYGSGYGPWVSLRPETLPLAYDAGITVLRWPGGEWGDHNDIRYPQLDQFVELARQMGAEPYIHVRFLDSTPDVAADVVRHANVEMGYDIRYWAIGNEPSLFEAGDHPWDAAAFSAEWRKFAAAMKAVDPTILLLGPETHQYTGTPDVDPVDSSGRDWLRTFLAANGDLVDIVAVHRYPFPNNAERTWATIPDLRADAPRWTEIARNLHAATMEETGRELPIAFTEVNSHWTRSIRGEATPDSLFSALWLGDVLGRLMTERVTMLTQFLLVTGGDSGFGLLEKYGPRPSYFTYQLYKYFGDTLVASSSPLDDVTAYAALTADGALTVMLINLTDVEQSLPLAITGLDDPAGERVRQAERRLFDVEHTAEMMGSVDTTAPVVLPAQSMTLLTFP